MLTCFKGFLGYLQLGSFDIKGTDAGNAYTRGTYIGTTYAGDVCIRGAYIKGTYAGSSFDYWQIVKTRLEAG